MTLTVVILSYNVSKLLEVALGSVYQTYKHTGLEVIVVDNDSTDDSCAMVTRKFPRAKLIKSHKNLGFSAGNNLARPHTHSEAVLFLNPDTKVESGTILQCLQILSAQTDLGAVTCKVMLPNGQMDYSCHRGLPTPWNSFCYWTGLSRLFPQSKMFSGYTASYLDIDTSHPVDLASGTFLMIRRSVLEEINWWDEDYFWNGEDVELCYRLNQMGRKIWYEPSVGIIHYKGSSSGLWFTKALPVSRQTQVRSAISAAKAMRIFVKKHRRDLGPFPIMLLVSLGIYLLEKFRLWKISSGFNYAN